MATKTIYINKEDERIWAMANQLVEEGIAPSISQLVISGLIRELKSIYGEYYKTMRDSP